MTKRFFLAASTALAVAACTIVAPTLAEAYVRPPAGGHASAHGGAHVGRGGGIRTAGNYRGRRGYGGYSGGYSGGFNGYPGMYYGSVCGPIQVVLGLCGPIAY